MTALIHPINRLAKAVKRPGGRTLDEMVQRAEANVEELREQSLEAIDEAIGRLRSATSADLGDGAVVQELYRAANDLFGLAGLYAMKALASAAHSLCELLNSGHAHTRTGRQAFAIHADAFLLLRTPQPPEISARLLDELAKLTMAARRQD